MKKDERIRKLAENILINSVELKKGEKVFIETFGSSTLEAMEEFVALATEIGAIPYYYYNSNSIIKQFFSNATEEQVRVKAELDRKIMEDCDAYVAIRGYDDVFELSDIPADKMDMYSDIYYKIVHFGVRIPKKRWCVTRYPNAGMAALAGMSVKQFEDFYFGATLVDYSKMKKSMQPLVDLMNKTDRVKIVAPDTNLEFSIKGIGAITCHGDRNMPDGEVFTAPVKNSINGQVRFNTDTVDNGLKLSNVLLKFKDGKIVEGTSSINNEEFQRVLDLDEGSRYIGEFALGLNPYINNPILDILFDEKIACSFHMAIGNSYDTADNGNKSSIHWDMIQRQRPENGGGEIYFDNVLIRKDGMFILEELKLLNPENLK